VAGALAAVTVAGMLLTIFRSGFFPPSGEAAAAGLTGVWGAVAGGVSPAGFALDCEFGVLVVGFWTLLSDTIEPLLHAAPDNTTNSATVAIIHVCVLLSICATILGMNLPQGSDE
jgi:hypothetical protein